VIVVIAHLRTCMTS